jgi:hypothetical protein
MDVPVWTIPMVRTALPFRRAGLSGSRAQGYGVVVLKPMKGWPTPRYDHPHSFALDRHCSLSERPLRPDFRYHAYGELESRLQGVLVGRRGWSRSGGRSSLGEMSYRNEPGRPDLKSLRTHSGSPVIGGSPGRLMAGCVDHIGRHIGD